ncbi:MarR family transcriptional regulator [Listeria booriae]|uniref:MarR family winged helix-turn-helix transcriptional regulator n=1 Tax=Listeria booriae TaxID=1552123 RepID=UPI0028802487|nr:MarR family transcriptional regulator [Listeria booriae]MDT0110833.1 MarR family transcriptional regulator [Listeria booriae]
MDEKQLNVDITNKYMNLSALFMQFFRENMRGGRGFGDRSRGQGRILSILHKTPLISQKDLVSQLDMKPQSASEMIQKLEKKGLIERHKSEQDKRIMMIQLTTKGRIAANHDEDFEPIILNVLSLEEKDQFNHILDKLIAELEPQVKRKRPMRRR